MAVHTDDIASAGYAIALCAAAKRQRLSCHSGSASTYLLCDDATCAQRIPCAVQD